jgi:integrase
VLTDTRIRNAKPATKPYKLTDGAGLYVEVRPTGARLLRYRYRVGGKENVFALGEYAKAPETETRKEAETRRAGGRFTLAEARAERDRCRGLVKQGIHPAHERKLETLKREHEGANTFEAVAREWIAQKAPHWTTRTKTQRERLFEREVFPAIGSLPIRQVTPAHVLGILKRLEREAPAFANLAQQAIGATFRLAVSTLRVDHDPTPALRGAIRTPPTQHKTPLQAHEIAEFFTRLEAYPSFTTRCALRLAWFTLVRTNEALGAKWSEFDLDKAEWRIAPERMKMRNPHVVPLSRQSIELLTRLHAVSGDGEYLFPNRSDRRKPAAITLLNKAVSSMGYAGKFSPHGIRTTGSTVLNELGFRSDLIERTLAHVERNKTRASYNQAELLPERKLLMQSWADHLDALCSGGKVFPIRGKAA